MDENKTTKSSVLNEEQNPKNQGQELSKTATNEDTLGAKSKDTDFKENDGLCTGNNGSPNPTEETDAVAHEPSIISDQIKIAEADVKRSIEILTEKPTDSINGKTSIIGHTDKEKSTLVTKNASTQTLDPKLTAKPAQTIYTNRPKPKSKDIKKVVQNAYQKLSQTKFSDYYTEIMAIGDVKNIKNNVEDNFFNAFLAFLQFFGFLSILYFALFKAEMFIANLLSIPEVFIICFSVIPPFNIFLFYFIGHFYYKKQSKIVFSLMTANAACTTCFYIYLFGFANLNYNNIDI